MKDTDIRAVIIEELSAIAPEIDEIALDPRLNFRDQFDFDSINYVSFVMALNNRLKVQIPEVDYPKLSSLEGCLRYLKALTDKS